MLSSIGKYISIFSLLSLATYPQEVFAEEDGAYFQRWEEGAQRGFVSTTIAMAITIASQADKTLANCIFDWYGQGNKEAAHARQDEVIKLIAGRYASHPPHAVVLAIIQKECGKFPAR